MAYRLAPLSGHPFAPVREIAAVASETANQILILRDEAQEMVDLCRRRVAERQSGLLNAQQTATLQEARERGFVLEIFDGCMAGGIEESMHIVVIPDLPMYVVFSNLAHEALHMPSLQRLAHGLGYQIERVATEFYMEAQITAGRTPVAEA